ncbi:MAG: hypothetical protein M0Z45_01985 [Actinomycetota bacterium]|nr:hypothetical protein [Actinomycetota bacterium]
MADTELSLIATKVVELEGLQLKDEKGRRSFDEDFSTKADNFVAIGNHHAIDVNVSSAISTTTLDNPIHQEWG